MIRWLAIFVALGAFAQSANDIRMWIALRQQILNDPTGKFFEENLRGAAPPVLEGTIVAMEPETRPHTLMIGIETPLVAELKLRIGRADQGARMHTTPPRKSKIRFRHAAFDSYTRQPFLVTATIDEMDLDYEDEAAQ
jgi:hypothetical protein